MKDNNPSSIIKQTRKGLLYSALLGNRSLLGWVRDGASLGRILGDGALIICMLGPTSGLITDRHNKNLTQVR